MKSLKKNILIATSAALLVIAIIAGGKLIIRHNSLEERMKRCVEENFGCKGLPVLPPSAELGR